MIESKPITQEQTRNQSLKLTVDQIEFELEFIKVNYVNLTDDEFEQIIRWMYVGKMMVYCNLLGLDHYEIHEELENTRKHNMATGNQQTGMVLLPKK